jgi:hypothetical protein
MIKLVAGAGLDLEALEVNNIKAYLDNKKVLSSIKNKGELSFSFRIDLEEGAINLELYIKEFIPLNIYYMDYFKVKLNNRGEYLEYSLNRELGRELIKDYPAFYSDIFKIKMIIKEITKEIKEHYIKQLKEALKNAKIK